MSKSEDILLDDVVEDNNSCMESIGKYKGIDLFIKEGKYGLYAKWGTEMKSLKDLGNIAIENVEYIEVLKVLEKDGVLDKTKPIGLVRDLSPQLSIRRGKFGDYIMYKKPRAKKPTFLKLKNFVGDYEKCDKTLLLSWIKNTYDV